LYLICHFFFFSSRRRHTRSKRDWSSDVCSSDLVLHIVRMPRAVDVRIVALGRRVLHVARRDRQDLRRIAPALALTRLRHLIVARSEERRVGKECNIWWVTEEYVYKVDAHDVNCS